ncbi:hypothetical protein [Streptomyces pseudovenezuelae]|uniref:hypothetical protein n=1 Tax=Streptomyces pseudovenezuelae TaxID=67350 RepID=UPI002E813E3F|nr:hypothetical protein [Streptomyces pseudovenezuelae]WUA90059.1 alpha/beta hydrolase [Streptomyces pseudovenezuelae]
MASGPTAACPGLHGHVRSGRLGHERFANVGHERFASVGHDRGANVTTRLALDHPEAVSAASTLEAIPIREAPRPCHTGFAAR